MQGAKELNAKIHACEREAKAQQARIKKDFDGTMNDQSMSKRREGSAGEVGNRNKKIQAQMGDGRNAYDSPANRTLQDAGRGRNKFGEETGTVGHREPRADKGKTNRKGTNKGKGKGKEEGCQKGANRFLPAPDRDGQMVKCKPKLKYVGLQRNGEY